MDFSEFTKIIYSYIGNGKEYPLFIEEFFRLFIPEYNELAYNDKNPFEKMDTSTLNAYLNGSKNISKKNASFIKSNYVGTDLIDKIESLSVDAKMQLIKELRIQMEKTQDDILSLAEIKQKLQDNEEIQEIANLQEIDTELSSLINHISNATETELENLKYNSVEVKEKFLPEEHLLKDEITQRVTKYYNFIDEQLKQKVEAENFNENKFRRSVKRVYEDLEAEGIEKTKIFEAISQRFYNIAKDNFTACQILTSYFVQSCEIFRKIKTEKLEKK